MEREREARGGDGIVKGARGSTRGVERDEETGVETPDTME